MASCQAYFNRMSAAFRKEAAAGLSAVYQFELSGEGGGAWVVAIRMGALEVREGRHEAPDVTLSAAARDYADIAEGRLSSMRALATRRLKIRGSMALAMKLPSLFTRSP